MTKQYQTPQITNCRVNMVIDNICMGFILLLYDMSIKHKTQQWQYNINNTTISYLNKKILLFVLFLFINFNLVNSHPNCTNQALSDDIIYTLMDFYNASDNTQYWVHKWDYNSLCNPSQNESYIPYGIQIDDVEIDVSLRFNNISGTLTDSLSKINRTLWLDLSHNSFTSFIFHFFYCLFLLVFLHIFFFFAFLVAVCLFCLCKLV